MSAEENVKIRKKNRWTQAMLEHLIKVWGKYYHELKMNSRGHDKIYAKIIEELAMVGCTASLEDVRGRIHNLSGKYRKEAAAEVATGRRSQWPYFYKIGRFFDYTVPAPVPTNARPVLYDMSQYLALEYAMEEESLDLEGNERILIQEGELSDEEHLEDGLDEEEDRSEADDWQSEHLEDYDNMEEDLADEAEEGPLVEVLPGEDGSSIAPFEPEKDPSEPDDGPLVPNNGPLVPNNGPLVPNNGPLVPNNGPIVPKKDDKVETPPTEERPSPGKQQPVTQKEKEKSVHTRDSDGGSQTQSPKGKVYHLNSVFRHETIDDFLRVLYSNRLYTDVTIITCHNGDICTIPAHQLVLANFSPYFSRIFENLKPASTGGSVALILPPDIPHSVMQILLEYMYTGGTDVPGEVIDDVVRCGSQLKIRGFWSEIKGEPTVKRPTQSSDDRTNKKARLDADDSSRSSTPSSPEYERISPRKPTRNKPDDDEVALTDVSSDIGLDLLRSDLDDEENDGDEDDDDDDDDEEDEDEDGTDDDEDDDDDDENEDDEDDNTNDNEHDDDDDYEEDEDDDDDDDQDDDEDDEDDDDGEEEHRIIKQERHKQKLKLEIPYNIIKQTTEKRIKEEDRICPKRRLDATKFNGESNSEHSESRTKRKCDTQATTSAASTRDQSPAEKSLHHAATDGTSKKGNLMKLWGNNVLNCRICSQRFTSVNEWLDHVVEMHGSEPCLLGKRTTENHITMLQCDLCQTYQESERGWLRHVLLRHAE